MFPDGGNKDTVKSNKDVIQIESTPILSSLKYISGETGNNSNTYTVNLESNIAVVQSFPATTNLQIIRNNNYENTVINQDTSPSLIFAIPQQTDITTH